MNDVLSPDWTAAPAAPAPGHARFTGSRHAYRKLMVRGALLQLVTLGVYRFWLTTIARRFLWANTEIEGNSLEYTGTGMELFLGFLMAIALLVPVYVLIFIGTLELGVLSRMSSSLGFLFLLTFGQYAYYRARRYRLTRTVFRGVRLHQSGSAWSYALRSLLWTILVGLTAGLAYPWAQASLERYKMANTYYGELQGGFVATGGSLFKRGIVLWLITILAFAGAIAASVWFSQAMVGAKLTPAMMTGKVIATILAIVFAVIIICAGVYVTLQAVVTKWWLAGVRFGTVEVVTTLRKRQIVGAYVRFVLYLILFSFVIGIILAGISTAALLGAGIAKGTLAYGYVAGAMTAVGYLATILAGWVTYQVTVKLRIWQVMTDSVEFRGFDAVERVHADLTRPSSAVGEGLADALGAGGI